MFQFKEGETAPFPCDRVKAGNEVSKQKRPRESSQQVPEEERGCCSSSQKESVSTQTDGRTV